MLLHRYRAYVIRRRHGLKRMLGKYSPSLEIHELTEPARSLGERVTRPTGTGLVWSHCPGIIISFTINTAPVRTARYVVTSANVLILWKRTLPLTGKKQFTTAHTHTLTPEPLKNLEEILGAMPPIISQDFHLGPHHGPTSVWDSHSQKCPLCLLKSPEPGDKLVYTSGNICQ